METIKINRCIHCMKDLEDSNTPFCPECGKPVQTVTQPSCCLRPNSILRGKYLVGRMLGQGGFGITYIGLDLALDTKVAIKECYPMTMASRDCSVSNRLQWNTRMTENDLWRQGCDNFLKEARKMAKMRDIPEVVRVQDTFEENNTAYIVMDFVEGITLKQWLEQNGIMQPQSCVDMLRPLITALGSLHQQGFIHRDISPDNIMVQPDGHLRLLDMGAAKELTTQDQHMSQLVTKQGFSPIEQYAENGDIGPWTDIYAMCATICYCLTGKPIPSAIDRLDSDGLVLPADLPEPLAAALTAGLAVDAKKRIRSADELLQRLDGKKSKPDPKPPKEKGAAKGKKWAFAAAGAAIVVALAAAALFHDKLPFFQSSSDPAAPEGIYVEELGTANANVTNYGGYAKIPDEYSYYIAADNALYLSKFNEEKQTFYLGDAKKVCDFASFLTLGPDRVYFISQENDMYSICRMLQNGSRITTLYSFTSDLDMKYLQYAKLSDGREYLYFLQENESGSMRYDLCRYDLREEDTETVVDGDLVWYNLYKDAIYYTDRPSGSDSKLIKTDLEGKNEEVLDTDKDLWYGFVEDDAIYLYSYKDETYLVLDLDGKQNSSFGGFYETDIDTDFTLGYGDGWIYYTGQSDQSLHRIRSNGTGDSAILDGHTAIYLCHSDDWLWFVENAPTGKAHQSATQIWFAYKDGDKLMDIQDPDPFWDLSEEDAQNFRYEDSGDGQGVVVTGYTGQETSFAIPDTIGGKPVVAIGEDAFKETDLVEVALPNGVTSVGKNAFSASKDLTFIGLPDSVQEIGDYAFHGCSSLSDADIPKDAVNIGRQAFADTKLSKVFIPAGVEHIGPGAFAVGHEAGLTQFQVESGNSSYQVKDGVLFNSSGRILEAYPSGRSGAYEIPEGTTKIQVLAFAHSTSLTELAIPRSVNQIGSDAFWNFPLTEITVSSGCELPDELSNKDITVNYYPD